ncbi:MAG: universal stress protein, partial [Balneolales bacterium]
MRNLNRILVPTDFSEGSQAAYEYAKKVTGVCGGVVNLMHIVPTLQYFSNSMNVVGYPPSLDQPKPGLEEEVLARLEEALLENFGKDHMGEAIVKLGRKTYMEIAREAEKKEYDLVIMGKTGSHGAFILGNVTEKVVRHSPKPVLSVNKKPQPDGLKRFMVPTDYSQYSLQSLHEAILLGSLTNGEIILFHVLELFGSPSENEPMIPDQDVENSVRMKLLNRVDTYLQARGEWNMQLVRDINGRTGHFLIRGEEEEEEA